jgi:tetratricopeptide (TPR) repeat protein
MDFRPRSLPISLLLLLPLHLCLFSTHPPDAKAAGGFDRQTRLESIGDYEGALQEYMAFVEKSPTDRLAPVAALAIARIEARVHHDSTQAVMWLDRIVKDYGTSTWASVAAREKGDIRSAEKQWRDAALAYEMGTSLVPEEGETLPAGWIGELTVLAADCYHRAGDMERMVGIYQRLLDGDAPPDLAATAHFRLAAALEAEGDTKGAAGSYRRIIEEYPSSPFFGQALAKREMIDPDARIDWTAYLAYAAGSDSVAARRYPGALEKCREVLASTTNPALVECATYRRITLETALSGDYTAGCGRLRTFLEDYPTGLRTEMARNTLENSWTQIAGEEAATRANPGDAAAWRALGGSYLQVRAPRAIDAYEKAAALEPDNAENFLGLGYAYASARRQEEAIRAFDRYLAQNPKDTNALNMIGYTYLGIGDAEKAIPYFNRYAELAPEDPNAHDSLAEGLMGAGRLEEAAAEYETAVRVNRSFSNSWFMLGQVYTQVGKNDRAVTSYERFLALVSTGPQADQARSEIDRLNGTKPGSAQGTDAGKGGSR